MDLFIKLNQNRPEPVSPGLAPMAVVQRLVTRSHKFQVPPDWMARGNYRWSSTETSSEKRLAVTRSGLSSAFRSATATDSGPAPAAKRRWA